ncbi:VOC family protein [Paenibacillus sp. GYB003]|uniref:VOC family protein n=1 Tax=Paenibacillus sp. GYB003 TaxID=2994392 RepID=UPI002F96730A
MAVKLLGSIFIPVSRLEASIAFYTEHLQLRCRGIEDWGDGERGATLFVNNPPAGAAMVTLAERKEPFHVSDRPLFNFSCGDVEEMHRTLQARGCRVTELVAWDSPWNRHLMFDVYDPDGHPINLIEMIPIVAPVR